MRALLVALGLCWAAGRAADSEASEDAVRANPAEAAAGEGTRPESTESESSGLPGNDLVSENENAPKEVAIRRRGGSFGVAGVVLALSLGGVFAALALGYLAIHRFKNRQKA